MFGQKKDELLIKMITSLDLNIFFLNFETLVFIKIITKTDNYLLFIICNYCEIFCA
jgi:hypothetical protein